MTITLTRTDPQGADREALVTFHTSAHFPFHVRTRPTRADLDRAVEGGEPLASVAYGVLRRDWETGGVTPVPWGDVTLDD